VRELASVGSLSISLNANVLSNRSAVSNLNIAAPAAVCYPSETQVREQQQAAVMQGACASYSLAHVITCSKVAYNADVQCMCVPIALVEFLLKTVLKE
jgi:hypothetical protein